MAHEAYIGVSGKARKVKKIYVGVGGKARNVKRGYIGVGGKARLFFKDSAEPGAMVSASALSTSRGRIAGCSLDSYAVFVGGETHTGRTEYSNIDAYNSNFVRTTKYLSGGATSWSTQSNSDIARLGNYVCTVPAISRNEEGEVVVDRDCYAINNSLVDSLITLPSGFGRWIEFCGIKPLGLEEHPEKVLMANADKDYSGGATINKNLVVSAENEDIYFYCKVAMPYSNGIISASQYITKSLVISDVPGTDFHSGAIGFTNTAAGDYAIFIDGYEMNVDSATYIINTNTMAFSEGTFSGAGNCAGTTLNGWGICAGGRVGGNAASSGVWGFSPELVQSHIGTMGSGRWVVGLGTVNNNVLIAGGMSISYNSQSTTQYGNVYRIPVN